MAAITDKQAIVDNFKKDYMKYGKFNLEVQIPHLTKLAEYYEDKYIKTKDWTDCLKAHALYNSVSVRKGEDNDEFSKRAFTIQQAFWGDNCKITYDQQKSLTTELKTALQAIRKRVRQENNKVEKVVSQFNSDDTGASTGLKKELYAHMQTISKDCSESMRSYAGQILQNSVEMLLVKPPCTFTAGAIGSLAKGEATPYSDLEYFFLIQNKNPSTINYFELLAVTSYFFIGNLGETKLSYMAIDELKRWFDDKANNGFKIDGLSDGAGNIPTGNGLKDKKNHFIVTPSELAERYKHTFQNPDPEESLRGDLTAMLAYTSPLYSFKEGETDGDLLQELQSKVKSHEQNDLRRAANMAMLQTDAEKFNFVPDASLIIKGYGADVKKELYRFPSIVSLDIALLCGSCGSSSWDTLQTLALNDSISQSLSDTLKFLLAAATYIRLSTYFFHNSHDDRMTVLPALSQQPEESTPNQSLKRWCIPISLFSAICCTMIPLKEFLAQNLFKIGDLSKFDYFSSDAWWSKVKALYFTNRRAEALSEVRQKYPNLSKEPVNSILNLVESLKLSLHEAMTITSRSLLECNEVKAALQLYTYMTKTLKLSKHWVIATCHRRLGEHEMSAEILQNIQHKTSVEYGTLGAVYRLLGKYDEAEEMLIQALQMDINSEQEEVLTDYYGNPLPTEGLRANTIDLHYLSPDQRLKKITNLHPFPHVHIPLHLQGLGSVASSQQQYLTAETYFSKSLEFMRELYGDGAAVPNIATTLSRLGTNYKNMGQYDTSVDYYRQALAVYREISQGADTMEIANTLFNLGLNYSNMKQYDKSVEYYTQALAAYREISQGADTKDIASTLFNLGNNYSNMKQYHKSVEYYTQALAAYREISPGADTKDIANTLFNLGNNYSNMKQYDKSVEYYTQALAAYREISQGADTEDIANTLFNLGLNYSNMKQYDKSVEYYIQALAMYREISQGADTEDTAKTLNNRGCAYGYAKKYSEAEESFQEAIAIYTDISATHEQAAKAQHNLGRMYSDMNQYADAEIAI